MACINGGIRFGCRFRKYRERGYASREALGRVSFSGHLFSTRPLPFSAEFSYQLVILAESEMFNTGHSFEGTLGLERKSCSLVGRPVSRPAGRSVGRSCQLIRAFVAKRQHCGGLIIADEKKFPVTVVGGARTSGCDL